MEKSLIFLFLVTLNLKMTAQETLDLAPLENRFALIVGVSDYQDGSVNDLKYAHKDAKDFQQALISFGRFKKENTRLLVNEQATREGIRKGIEGWLKKAVKKDDLVIIFFSGHGSQIEDTDGDETDNLDECLVPFDYDNNDESTLISDDEFAYWVKNLKSEKVLIVFDNCFSGGAAKQKGLSIPHSDTTKVKDDFSQDIVREVPKKGTALIAASQAYQVSNEHDSLKNGIFTYYLIKSINAKADLDLNKIIDHREIFSAAFPQTLGFCKGRLKDIQEPILVDSLDVTLDLFYLPIEKPISVDQKKKDELLYRLKQVGFSDHQKKVDILNEVYLIDPSDIHINLNLAEEHESLSQFTKAYYYYELAYTLSKNQSGGWRSIFFPSIPHRIGSFFRKQGAIEQAKKWYLIDERDSPGDTRAIHSVANVYLDMSDTLAAIEKFNHSISVQPLQQYPYLSLFYIYLSKNDLTTAYKVIKKCHEINTGDFETIYWMGMMERYYNKNKVTGDSLLAFFEAKSGVNGARRNLELGIKALQFKVGDESDDNNDIKDLPRLIMQSLNQFPYLASFYKQLIEGLGNNFNVSSKYLEKYKFYSKLTSDNVFLETHVKK